MKNMILVLTATSLIAGSSAFAGNIGQGMIGSGQIYPGSANLSLSSLKEEGLYDVTCKVSDPDAQAYPVVVKFDVQSTPYSVMVYLDGQMLNTRQGRLSDNNEHTVQFTNVKKFNDAVVLTWLAGDGIADPVHYNCSAYPVVGLAK